MQILDPVTMIEVPADGLTVGEVMVRGNVVMKGYLSNEKATRCVVCRSYCSAQSNPYNL
jgi:long-subunit acyl-CoA synthetase (AMP-forming)